MWFRSVAVSAPTPPNTSDDDDDNDDDDDDDDDEYSDEWMTKTTDTKTRRQKAAKTHILHPSPG